MRRVFNHTAHKEEWDWHIHNPEKFKSDWPGWKENGGQYDANGVHCFACMIALDVDRNCDKCPLIWPPNNLNKVCCEDSGGLWFRWSVESNIAERSRLAAQIRDLPVRFGIKCI